MMEQTPRLIEHTTGVTLVGCNFWITPRHGQLCDSKANLSRCAAKFHDRLTRTEQADGERSSLRLKKSTNMASKRDQTDGNRDRRLSKRKKTKPGWQMSGEFDMAEQRGQGHDSKSKDTESKATSHSDDDGSLSAINAAAGSDEKRSSGSDAGEGDAENDLPGEDGLMTSAGSDAKQDDENKGSEVKQHADRESLREEDLATVPGVERTNSNLDCGRNYLSEEIRELISTSFREHVIEDVSMRRATMVRTTTPLIDAEVDKLAMRMKGEGQGFQRSKALMGWETRNRSMVIVSGAHRYAAARKAKLREIPVVVINRVDDCDVMMDNPTRLDLEAAYLMSFVTDIQKPKKHIIAKLFELMHVTDSLLALRRSDGSTNQSVPPGFIKAQEIANFLSFKSSGVEESEESLTSGSTAPGAHWFCQLKASNQRRYVQRSLELRACSEVRSRLQNVLKRSPHLDKVDLTKVFRVIGYAYDHKKDFDMGSALESYLKEFEFAKFPALTADDVRDGAATGTQSVTLTRELMKKMSNRVKMVTETSKDLRSAWPDHPEDKQLSKYVQCLNTVMKKYSEEYEKTKKKKPSDKSGGNRELRQNEGSESCTIRPCRFPDQTTAHNCIVCELSMHNICGQDKLGGKAVDNVHLCSLQCYNLYTDVNE